jgi:hypothetical protein
MNNGAVAACWPKAATGFILVSEFLPGFVSVLSLLKIPGGNT